MAGGGLLGCWAAGCVVVDGSPGGWPESLPHPRPVLSESRIVTPALERRHFEAEETPALEFPHFHHK